MLRTDEDALVCDFAEYYHIYDYRGLRPLYAATLACGLDNDSRIKRKISGREFTTEQMLVAAAVDRLSLLVWSKTKASQRGKNRPKSILEGMIRKEEPEDIRSYASADAFEAAREKIWQKHHSEQHMYK